MSVLSTVVAALNCNVSASSVRWRVSGSSVLGSRSALFDRVRRIVSLVFSVTSRELAYNLPITKWRPMNIRLLGMVNQHIIDTAVPAHVSAPVSNEYLMRASITAFRLAAPVRLDCSSPNKDAVIRTSTAVERDRPVVKIHRIFSLNLEKVHR